MSTEQRQRASVSQSLAINRLLEFIIVSSYDVEEPRGLGRGGRQCVQHHWLLADMLVSVLTTVSLSVSPFLSLLFWGGGDIRAAGTADNSIFWMMDGWWNKMGRNGRRCMTLHFGVLVWQRAGWLPLDTDHTLIFHNGKGHIMCDLPQIKRGRQPTPGCTDAECQRTKITSKMPAEVWT